MRIYDPRLGRFLSVDPLTKEYAELTPYQFASNRPIDGIDRDGLEWNGVSGIVAGATGYNLRGGNQQQQAKTFIKNQKEAFKKPDTYVNGLLMMRPFVLMAMTVPFGGVGGGMLAEADATAVSTGESAFARRLAASPNNLPKGPLPNFTTSPTTGVW